MAVRFTAATQNYSATNGLPGSTYTFCAWVRPATVGAGNRVVFWLTASSDVFTGIEMRDTLNNLQAYDSNTYSFDGLGPLTITANTWYRCALVVAGANATFYRSATGSALGSASASDFTTSASPTTWYIGDDPYDEWWDGRIAAVKAWSAALTAAEVENELAQYAPVRTANLLRFHPFLRAETTDYSGAGNTLSGGTGATTEDGPPIPWRVIRPRLIIPASGTAPVTLGQAVETDTATALGRAKGRTVGLATETDTGQALTRAKNRAVGLASEADTATSLGRAKLRTLSQAIETDTATVLGRQKNLLLGIAGETDTSTVLARAKNRAVGLASETDTAGTLSTGSAITLGQAVETNTAAALGRTKTRTVGQATETDTAMSVTRAKARALGIATETDTATLLARAKLRALGLATELDQALAFVNAGIAWPPAAGTPRVVEPYTASPPVIKATYTAGTPTVR